MIRRAAAAVLFLAIVFLASGWMLMTLPFRDRGAIARAYAARPDRGNPAYRLFLADVRAHTGSGDTIAIVVPWREWEGGYSYAYYRASYALAGREALPLIYPRADARENLGKAKYLAVWGLRPRTGEVIVRSNGGTLVKLR